MVPQEKLPYHQIHPAKLLVDWGAGLFALYFFWKRALLVGLLMAVVPPLVVSGLLIRFASLEKYAESRSGQFVKKHMTRARELLRFRRIRRDGVRRLVPPALADSSGTFGNPLRLVRKEEK